VPLTHWVGRGTGRPKDKDEVNKREVSECEGWVWDLDAIGDPSRLSTIRKSAALARARSQHLKSKVGLALAKAAVLRINLNIDGAPYLNLTLIASKSHTHPSHSQTSRLLTSSLISLHRFIINSTTRHMIRDFLLSAFILIIVSNVTFLYPRLSPFWFSWK
jgi:hypothetical protein